MKNCIVITKCGSEGAFPCGGRTVFRHFNSSFFIFHSSFAAFGRMCGARRGGPDYVMPWTYEGASSPPPGATPGSRATRYRAHSDTGQAPPRYDAAALMATGSDEPQPPPVMGVQRPASELRGASPRPITSYARTDHPGQRKHAPFKRHEIDSTAAAKRPGDGGHGAGSGPGGAAHELVCRCYSSG